MLLVLAFYSTNHGFSLILDLPAQSAFPPLVTFKDQAVLIVQLLQKLHLLSVVVVRVLKLRSAQVFELRVL